MTRRFALASALAACLAASAAAVIRSSTYAWDPIWDDGKVEAVDYAVTGDSLQATDCRITLRLRGGAKAIGGEFEMSILRARHGTPAERMSIWLDRGLSSCDVMTWSNGVDSLALTRDGTRRWLNGHTELKGDTVEVAAARLVQSSRSRMQAVYYEALPVWLRGRELEAPGRDSVALLQAETARSESNTTSVPAEIEVVGPAGPPSETSRGGLQVNVRHGKKVDRLWFHPGPGHVMLAWERSDGMTLTFKKLERRLPE